MHVATREQPTKSDCLPIMDVIIGNPRPTRTTRPDLAATLGDPARAKDKTMTESPSYQMAIPHKSAGFDVNTAVKFQDRVLAVNALQKAQESWAAVLKS